MTARDFSVMNVIVVDQEKVSLPRAVRSKGSLQPSDVVEVEFGARWTTIAGRQEKEHGSWHPCRIIRIDHSDLLVELLSPLRTTIEEK